MIKSKIPIGYNKADKLKDKDIIQEFLDNAVKAGIISVSTVKTPIHIVKTYKLNNLGS